MTGITILAIVSSLMYLAISWLGGGGDAAAIDAG